MIKHLLTLSVLLCALVGASQGHADEILRKMETVMRGDQLYAEITMEIVRPRYTREMTMKSWAMGEDYSLILVTEPARDRGTAYLKREREIWNWMPSIDRMIKLPPSMMGQSWMGTDFTNDDLVRESSVIDDYTHRIVREELVGEVLCYVIELVPKPDKPIVWSKVLMWIAKDGYFQVKVEQYDERGGLVNTLSFGKVRTFGKRTLPTEIILEPATKRGHRTVLRNDVMDFNPDFDESFFSVMNLQRIR